MKTKDAEIAFPPLTYIQRIEQPFQVMRPLIRSVSFRYYEIKRLSHFFIEQTNTLNDKRK